MKSKKDLLIATSGCGGGCGGPWGVYDDLQPYLEKRNMVVMSINTIRKSVDKNVSLITKTILDNIDVYRHFYLMGWSMGGATVIQVAHKINHELDLNKVKGIVLLATQSAKTKMIEDLDIPIIFYHGKEDTVLRHKISIRMHKRYKHKKMLVLFDKLNHDFTDNTVWFAKIIAEDMANLFIESS